MSLLICRFRFSIFVLETLKFEWQCSQYLILYPTCATTRKEIPVYGMRLRPKPARTSNCPQRESVFEVDYTDLIKDDLDL